MFLNECGCKSADGRVDDIKNKFKNKINYVLKSYNVLENA